MSRNDTDRVNTRVPAPTRGRGSRGPLWVLVLAAVAAVFGAALPSCRRAPAAGAEAAQPSLRLYVVSTAAGALEPCGCTKDQLGGVNHAAAWLSAEAKAVPHSLVVGAGPMLFLNPRLEEARATQDLWKAEALAASLGDLGLVAWAPGANDWAAGAGELSRLAGVAHADVLAANVTSDGAAAKATRVVEVGGYRVGLAGVAEPRTPVGAPPGVLVADARAALERGLADLKAQGAQVLVALVALERGRALRLAEQIPGFHAFVVGKPYDQGEGNDPPIPPALVGDTLVVQGPNHVQGIAIVDLFVRGPLQFRDGTGIARMEKRQSLEGRIGELERRIQASEASGASAADVAARREDLARLRTELATLGAAQPPAEGSFFRYAAKEIREALGSREDVARRLDEYYRRVNDHNREAFKDRVPAAPRPGEASYIGAEACSTCHDEAYQFWKKTPHARAYDTLTKQHKEFNLDCVSCHVTGYDRPGGTTVTHVAKLSAVQCEACHGPGSRHQDDPDDTSALVLSPPKTLCAPACHHPPHVPEQWSPDDGWKVILGKGHGAK